MKIIIAGLIALIAMPGCSIYKAATAPPPVAVENVKVGSSRPEVISIFGIPKRTDDGLPGQKIDMFEFTDGYHAGSKARIIVYVGGDVVTLGLAELVFWPMELAFLQGSEGRAVVTYGPDNMVTNVTVTTRDGQAWKDSSASGSSTTKSGDHGISSPAISEPGQ
jgi:hypothetical protein